MGNESQGCGKPRGTTGHCRASRESRDAVQSLLNKDGFPLDE